MVCDQVLVSRHMRQVNELVLVRELKPLYIAMAALSSSLGIRNPALVRRSSELAEALSKQVAEKATNQVSGKPERWR